MKKNVRGKALRLMERRRKRNVRRSRKRQLARINTLNGVRVNREYGAAVPVPGSKGKRARKITPPSAINLTEGYEETVRFLEKVRLLRRASRANFFVDFKAVKSISAAGAMLVVAEFDRWRESTGQNRLISLELDQWETKVRRRLKEMGFFSMLRAACPIDDGINEDGERFLPFSSGHRSEGPKAKALRLAIEALGPKIRDRDALFEGLTEAMANVKNHAYRDRERIKRWWMSASVDASARRLTVMFVDHGLSIPRTVKRKFKDYFGSAVPIKELKEVFSSDAKLIEAAVTLHRSSTEEPNRGLGLKMNIQGYIERHEAVGMLRIVSGRGEYIYQKRTGQDDRIKIRSLPTPFKGTFIEWIVEDYAADNENE